jgi:hypothetical protein
VEYSDASRSGGDAHEEFQEWRRNNPDGFFLNRRPSGKYMLHHVSCHHLGDPWWKVADWGRSLTHSRKICCVDYGALEKWAADQGDAVVDCQDCIDYEAE